MARLTNFAYGMIITIGVFAVLFAFASKLMLNYSVPIPAEHNETFIQLSNMTAIDEQTEDLKEIAFKENINASTSFLGRLEEKFDIIGLYFTRGYKAVQIFPKTVGIFTGMVSSLLSSNAHILGIAAAALRFIIISLVIVAVVGVIISLLVKWWI